MAVTTPDGTVSVSMNVSNYCPVKSSHLSATSPHNPPSAASLSVIPQSSRTGEQFSLTVLAPEESSKAEKSRLKSEKSAKRSTSLIPLQSTPNLSTKSASFPPRDQSKPSSSTKTATSWQAELTKTATIASKSVKESPVQVLDPAGWVSLSEDDEKRGKSLRPKMVIGYEKRKPKSPPVKKIVKKMSLISKICSNDGSHDSDSDSDDTQYFGRPHRKRSRRFTCDMVCPSVLVSMFSLIIFIVGGLAGFAITSLIYRQEVTDDDLW